MGVEVTILIVLGLGVGFGIVWAAYHTMALHRVELMVTDLYTKIKDDKAAVSKLIAASKTGPKCSM